MLVVRCCVLFAGCYSSCLVECWLLVGGQQLAVGGWPLVVSGMLLLVFVR